MKYLFLDDEREPKDVTWVCLGNANYNTVDWSIVRSYDEAVAWVLEHGFPDVASLDHDLGLQHYAGDYSDNNTGYDFAKWLVEYDMNTSSMPHDFVFIVHSRNPVGAKNIQMLLNNYISKGKVS